MSVGANMLLLWRKPRILLVCAAAACGGLLFGYDLGAPPSQSSCLYIIICVLLQHSGGICAGIEKSVMGSGFIGA